MNLTSPYSFLLASSPYSGRGYTNCMAEWYRDLVEVTKAYIHDAGFEPTIYVLLERSARAMLVQSLTGRWWDTTHIFHVSEREMTMISL